MKNTEMEAANSKAGIKFVTKDSGSRQSFDTGAVRDTQDGKPRFDLIPNKALTRVAELYARGAIKYGDRNWEKGMPASRFYSSALRHLFQHGRGEVDEDHLAAVIFNCLAIMQFQEEGRKDLLDS
jgi:hypothetical protein